MGLRVGAARISITPPVGVELAGYAFGPSVGVLDDLEAQALVVDVDGEQAAIVTADLLGFGADLVGDVRRRVESMCGIPADRIMLAASHTHSGPATMFLRYWGATDPDYARVLPAHLAGLVAMARASAREARLSIGRGRAATIAENRRVSGGAVDMDVPVLRVDGLDGRPFALLYGFACHPVALHSYRGLISPDYPGYARRTIQAVLGRDVVVLFALGPAGDVNPAGYVAGETTPERAAQIGAILGCEAARAAIEAAPTDVAGIGLAREVVALPVEPLPTAEELRVLRDQHDAQTRRLREEGRPYREVSGQAIRRDWAADALRAVETGTVLSSLPCELQALRLGDAAIMAVPVEVFAETGLAVKGASLAGLTVLSTVTNGELGYLPSADVYESERDYVSPRGVAHKVVGVYCLGREAEPLFRSRATAMLASLFSDQANG